MLIFFQWYLVAQAEQDLFGLLGRTGSSGSDFSVCPLSCQGRGDREVGVVIVINLPGVMAGGKALQKGIWEYQYRGGIFTIAFSFLLLWGAVYQCAEAPLVC